LPNQHYPKHKHIQKDETYFILYGNLVVWVEGVGETVLTPGETYSVKQNTLHSFSTKTGVVFEEIATAYIKGDSVYDDNSINLNKKRKTTVTYS
jgi:N-acetylneuraminate synthase